MLREFKMFKASITALATPFADGKVDEAALRSLIEWQVFAGIIARGTADGR
jgi:4-hydroxy-tetrahydrodipicolinate synthase